MNKNEKITIAFAHDIVVDTEFALSMMEIVRKLPDRIASYHCVEGTGLLTKSRNIVVKHFLDTPSTGDWLLMVDTDQRVPVESLEKLIQVADKNKRPVVSGLVFAAVWNGLSLRPVPAIFYQTEDGGILPLDNYPKNTIVEIAACGAAYMLIHRSVLEKIRENAPEDIKDWCWFQDGPINGNRWLSEDLIFSTRIRENGFKIHAHTGALAGHHKMLWIEEAHYDQWIQANPAGTGLEQLM
jgi:hypothetical protein